jgi:serine/threonine-protein kinase
VLRPNPFVALPGGASMRVAARRSTRVGERSGVPLEDLGVVPDERYCMTRKDLLERNVDLIAHAAKILKSKPSQTLRLAVTGRAPFEHVDVESANIDRVDLFVDGRPVASSDVGSGNKISMALPKPIGSRNRVEAFGLSRRRARRPCASLTRESPPNPPLPWDRGEARQRGMPPLTCQSPPQIIRSSVDVRASDRSGSVDDAQGSLTECNPVTSGSPPPAETAIRAAYRGPDFDPRTDTIVRVQARRLRLKLDDYYRHEGAGDAVRLCVPKGRYLVEFGAAPESQEPRVGPTLTIAPAAEAAPAGRDSPPATVVLPFVNLSGDEENDYFTDGLTDEITSRLATVQDLRVVSRTSAFQFKGRSDDVRRIGADLGVQTALEGSVRKDGPRVRVAAQLVDVGTGFHLWSHAFDGELPGVFGLQERIAGSIADALRVRVGPLERQRFRPAEPASIEVYDLHLKGLACFYRGTPYDLRACVEYMERATAIDAGYAPAHAAMAEACALGTTLSYLPAPQLLARAREAAQRALALDDLAEAHAAMGTVLWLEWQFGAAEAAFLRAIALKPSYVYPRLAYATVCLCVQRRYEEAVGQLRIALTLDPLSAFSRTILAQTMVLAGRASEAIDELHRAIALAPDFVFAYYTLGLAHILRRSYAEAVTALDPIRHMADQLPNCAGHLGFAHASLGNRAEAMRLLQPLLDHAKDGWAPWIDIAAVHAGLGDEAEALDWLERGYRHRCFDVLFLGDDPRFDILRDDARFRQIAEHTAPDHPVGGVRC